MGAILLHGRAYALRAILGVGAGVLIRSQLAATITLRPIHVVGFPGSATFLLLIGDRFGKWFPAPRVLVPPQASQLLVNGAHLPGGPPRRDGAEVLILDALSTGSRGH